MNELVKGFAKPAAEIVGKVIDHPVKTAVVVVTCGVGVGAGEVGLAFLINELGKNKKNIKAGVKNKFFEAVFETTDAA